MAKAEWKYEQHPHQILVYRGDRLVGWATPYSIENRVDWRVRMISPVTGHVSRRALVFGKERAYMYLRDWAWKYDRAEREAAKCG